jgi:anaphase-promoting complex subunit 3
MFKRATQIDPAFTYAYTLIGHEYAAGESFEKALNSFQTALRMDSRHYNAWYGLGSVYARQEKYDLAEIHIRKALEINPFSSALRSFLGVILQAQSRVDEAIDELERAISISPANTMAKYHLASAHASKPDGLKAAAKILKELLFVAPREAAVYVLLGKIYRQRGNNVKAIQCFGAAADLDPKAAMQVKPSIERIQQGQESDSADEP